MVRKWVKLFTIVSIILATFLISSLEGGWLMRRETLRERLERIGKENNWGIAGINDNDIVKISVLGKELFHITIGEKNRTCGNLSSSPDGLKFAFWKTIFFDKSILYTINSDGTGLKELFSIPKEPYNGSISWAPSGKLIAFIVGYSRQKKEDLYIIDVESGKSKILIENIGGISPQAWSPSGISPQAWSPDGNKIVYESCETPAHEIMIIDINTKETKKIAEGKYPSWSPDGKKIAFKDKEGNCYIINHDGSNKQLLLKGKTSFIKYIKGIYQVRGNLLWSPDSKYILYDRITGMKGVESTLYIMDVESKESIKIGRFYFTPSVWVNH
ncbi:MAG: DPP IV N-terminal domain-containing protein [bacterium]|nr:DPP IV N-terminal domain-containing protein [bacterium]